MEEVVATVINGGGGCNIDDSVRSAALEFSGSNSSDVDVVEAPRVLLLDSTVRNMLLILW